MGLQEKVAEALRNRLPGAYVRLEDDDGISGFVVSSKFKGKSSRSRVDMIDEAIKNAPNPLTPSEWRQILMIAGLAPEEYQAVGPAIRIHKVESLGDGGIRILLRGAFQDAEYVRGALKGLKGVETSEPEECPGARGILMQFQATGSKADPLTVERVVRVLEDDPYISLVSGGCN